MSKFLETFHRNCCPIILIHEADIEVKEDKRLMTIIAVSHFSGIVLKIINK